MANGQEAGRENVFKFKAWVAEQTHADYREMEYRGSLNRGKIAKGCGFAKSVLLQNPEVRQQLENLEEALRAKGVLPKLIASKGKSGPKKHDQSKKTREQMDRHSKHLQKRVTELEAEVEALKLQLSRYEPIASALSRLGRMPR